MDIYIYIYIYCINYRSEKIKFQKNLKVKTSKKLKISECCLKLNVVFVHKRQDFSK